MLLPTVCRLFRPVLRTQRVPAAHMTTNSSKNTVAAGDQAIAMIVLFGALLGPSFWILAHLNDYKKKE